jgi:hypothetical protein
VLSWGVSPQTPRARIARALYDCCTSFSLELAKRAAKGVTRVLASYRREDGTKRHPPYPGGRADSPRSAPSEAIPGLWGSGPPGEQKNENMFTRAILFAAQCFTFVALHGARRMEIREKTSVIIG